MQDRRSKPRVASALAAILALGGAAVAQAPTRDAEGALRRTLNDGVRAAVRAIDDTRRQSLGPRSADGKLLSATLATQGCAASDDAYWTAAAEWMVGAVTPRLDRGAVLDRGQYEEAQRGQVRDVARAIDGAATKRFLASGERSDAAPESDGAALRQQAEWTAMLPSVLRERKARHDANPTSLSTSLDVAVWTRAFCETQKRNAAMARQTLAAGYPGADSERAFAFLVATSGDATLVTEALAAGGEKMSPQARDLLQPRR